MLLEGKFVGEFLEKGTQICLDLVGLAQILFVWMWLDVGLGVMGTTNSFLRKARAMTWLCQAQAVTWRS